MKKKIVFTSAIVLALVCMMLFVACAPPSDPSKAAANLDDEGYTVVSSDGTLLSLAGIKNVTNVVSATKTTDNSIEAVTIIYFKTSKDAKNALEDAKQYAEKNEDDQEKKDKDSDDSNWTFGHSGKIIWFGTKAAVKASR